LKPTRNAKDTRVTLVDLSNFLTDLSTADLEDVKWFAESVVKVESDSGWCGKRQCSGGGDE